MEKNLIRACSYIGSMSTMVQWRHGRKSRKLRGHILNFKHEAERMNLKCCESVFKLSRPTYSNILPSARPVKPLRQHHQLGTKDSNACDYGGTSHSNHQRLTTEQIGLDGFSKKLQSCMGKGKGRVDLGGIVWGTQGLWHYTKLSKN